MEAVDPAARLPGDGRADIPFRDYAPGDWDDWPPIFTPMYAMYHGAVGHTVEIPLQVNGARTTRCRSRSCAAARRSTPTWPRRRSAAPSTYADTNRAQLLADQIEQFRRGWAGEPSAGDPGRLRRRASARRTGTRTEFPRAYVIPAGAGQRSAGRRRPAGRPPRRPRRAGDQGPARRSRLAGQVLPGRLVRGRHAPAQARPGQRAAGGRPGHLRPGAADVRHLRLEPPPALGRVGRHQRDRGAAGSTTSPVSVAVADRLR